MPKWFCCFLLILASCHSGNLLTGAVVEGKADLSSLDFKAGTMVRLDGTWDFWSGELVNPFDDPLVSTRSTLHKVPGRWSSLRPLQPDQDLVTTGTLSAQVILPPGIDRWAFRVPNGESALRVLVDGVVVTEIGRVSDRESDHIPQNGLRIGRFLHPGGEITLTLQVSNWSTPYTGTWDSLVIGAEQTILDKRHWDLVITSLIGGALLFMGLYHLSLFILRRNDTTTLWFGLICLLMGIRNLIMGERILITLFPLTPQGWQTAFTIEHLSAHLTLPLFYLFFRKLFPGQVPKLALGATLGVGGLWAFLEIFTPALFHHRFLPWYEYFLLAGAVFLVGGLVAAAVKKQPGAGIALTGGGLLLLASANDVLLSNGIIQSFYMSSIGVFLFTFAQSFLLSRRFSNLFHMVANYSEHLEKLNHSLERFIPHEILQYLGKKSIIDVSLGDYSEQLMSVFFLDIRDFTALSETLSPQDNFRLINSFLKRVGPVIREYGGFVDKYLGDGFMALFHGAPDKALQAALDIRKQLAELNLTRGAKNRPVLKVGMGIHTGMLMLGTIGENERMDSTVISDTVNTASRLESMTKNLGCDILLSAQTAEALENPGEFRLSHVGDQTVKGKISKIGVYRLD